MVANISPPWERQRLLVIEKRENNLVLETHTFLCSQGGVLDALEYILHEKDLATKDKIKFALYIFTRRGGRIKSSKYDHLSWKFYYLP